MLPVRPIARGPRRCILSTVDAAPHEPVGLSSVRPEEPSVRVHSVYVSRVLVERYHPLLRLRRGGLRQRYG
jgi:hypothetical protein